MLPLATSTSVAAPATSVPASPGPMSPPNSRLDKAAHQFEAMLLQELLKPLTSSRDEGGDAEVDSLTGGSSSGPLQSFGTQAVAESLANTGALGFATQIASSLQQHASVSTIRDTSPGNLSGTR